MPVDSKLLGNTDNAFQLTGNKHVLHKGCDVHGSGAQSSAQSGGGYGATFKSLQTNANNGMGYGNGSYDNYNVCNKQSGGSAHLNELNNSAASSYGYTNSGAEVAHELKGSYAAITKNNNVNSCSGGRKRKRKPKGKSRKRKPKGKSRKRKSRKRKSRKRKPKRKSRRRKPKGKSRKRKPKGKSRKRRKSRKTRQSKRSQKGGSSVSYSALNSNLTGNDARILGTNSFLASDKNCGDGYNHYTGGNEKTMY